MKAYRIPMGLLVLFALLIVSPTGNVLGRNQSGRQEGNHNGRGFLSSLTQEQRETVHSTVMKMKEEGASREEIHAAVAEMLKGYGIEPPEKWGEGFPGDPRRFFGRLTHEQRKAVQEKVKEMRSQGATREEIHTTVAEMLKGYGIEPPEHWGKGHWGVGRHFLSSLTDEQRKVVREKMKEMRQQGATREEIHAAVAEMLKGYGIEVPEHWGEGHRGGRRRFFSSLTDEQRTALREKVKEMRDQGASPERIRTAVAEMLKEYGIELPEHSGSLPSETASAELHILIQSYPNPFNPETQIAYALDVPGNVRVKICNVAGQVIRTFEEGYRPAGSYNLRWDGCNESGNPAASGIYFYHIEAGPYAVTGRMVLLR